MKTVWKRKNSTSHDPDFEEMDDQLHKLTQSELSDLIRDLVLSQEKAELLGSRLQQGSEVDSPPRGVPWKRLKTAKKSTKAARVLNIHLI